MNKQKQAFTLVELIVVITILAILGTIAIMAFSGYSKNARDSARITDLSNIKKSLELWILQSGTYPEPSESSEINYSGGLVWKQGTFGESVINTVGRLEKKPVDPLYEVDYTYSVIGARKEYQLGAVLEKNTASIGMNQTYAAGTKKAEAYILGTYNGVLTTTSGIPKYILALPSIILSDISDVELKTTTSTLSYEGKSNLPASYNDTVLAMTGSDFNFMPIEVWSGSSLEELNNQSKFQELVEKVQEAYKTETTFATLPEYMSIVSTDIHSVGAMSTIKELIEINTSQELTNVSTTILEVIVPPIYSCTGSLVTANANITNTTGLTGNTLYQNSDSGNSCYYTCNATYSGTNCENREVFGDEDADAIAACNLWVQNAVGTSAGGYANWIWVPARYFTTDGVGISMIDDFYKRTVSYNSENYTCKGFAVMKYEAKFADTTTKSQPDALWKTWAVSDYTTDNDTFPENLTNGIVSKASDYPVASVRQGEAIHACSGLNYNSKTSHLITNNEWMTIARNIEAQNINWTNGLVGSGGIYRGNVNLTDTMSYSSSGTTGFYTQAAGNDSDVRGTNLMGNRRLVLSNGVNIWDLSGNVWEHVNKSNIPTTSNNRGTNTWNSSTERVSNACNGVNNWASFYSNDGVDACSYTNGYTYANIGPAITSLNTTNGIGRVYSYNMTSNIFLRGGTAYTEVNAGVFAIHLAWDAVTWYMTVGFRCSF